MDSVPHNRFVLADRSYLNLIKRDIAKLAESYGFTEAEVGRINIVVAELASNLIKHTTTGGTLLVKRVHDQSLGIEIISLDKGPGMKDPERMLQDGVSTFGSAGEGLGAVKRITRDFEIFSQPGIGTAMLARFFREPPRPVIPYEVEKLQIGVVLVPKPGETACGDAFTWRRSKSQYLFLAADGLGHGAGAQEASQTVLQEFGALADCLPCALLGALHKKTLRTRGAVAMAVQVDPETSLAVYCGIGNIAGRVISFESSKNLISYNGILGHNVPGTYHDQKTVWQTESVLILNSDGLKSQLDLSKLPGLMRHDASLIAAVLYKHFSRGSDDSLVAVIKKNPNLASKPEVPGT